MRAVIQRVTKGSVSVKGQIVGAIGPGLMVLVGFTATDGDEEIAWMARKIAGLRIFADEEGKMNLSARDIDGQVLVVPNFTLYGDVTKGRRPSFTAAASPQQAQEAFEEFVQRLKAEGIEVQTGQFGQYMQVEIVNDGPVTLIIDTKAMPQRKASCS